MARTDNILTAFVIKSLSYRTPDLTIAILYFSNLVSQISPVLNFLIITRKYICRAHFANKLWLKLIPDRLIERAYKSYQSFRSLDTF